MKIGDIVYPAYDSKPIRSTKCKITDIIDDKIYVKGIFWGHNNEEIRAFSKGIDEDFPDDYVAYIGDNQSLMSMIVVSESGDYYQLITGEEMGEIQKFLKQIGSKQIKWH